MSDREPYELRVREKYTCFRIILVIGRANAGVVVG